jgi:hypothetical protein
MEHSRGATLASQVVNKGGKDMDIGAVMKGDGYISEAPSRDPLIWSLQSELGHRSADGDWDAVHARSGAVYVLGKGEGKSKGGGKGFGTNPMKGSYGKNGSKGMEASDYDTFRGKGKGGDIGKGGGGNKTFDGYCNRCWTYGHRKSECRLLDADMSRKGGGKGGNGKDTYVLQAEGDEVKDGETTREDGSAPPAPSAVTTRRLHWCRFVSFRAAVPRQRSAEGHRGDAQLRGRPDERGRGQARFLWFLRHW